MKTECGTSNESVARSAAHRSSSWDPPIPPFVKVNFDAAVSNERSCFAAIGRGHTGDLIFSRIDIFEDSNPLRVEAKAFPSSHHSCGFGF